MGTPTLQHPAMPCVCAWHSHVLRLCNSPFSPTGPVPGWDCPPGGCWLATLSFQLLFQMHWALSSFGAAPELTLGLKVVREGGDRSHMGSIFSEEESPALFPKLTVSGCCCAPAGCVWVGVGCRVPKGGGWIQGRSKVLHPAGYGEGPVCPVGVTCWVGSGQV